MTELHAKPSPMDRAIILQGDAQQRKQERADKHAVAIVFAAKTVGVEIDDRTLEILLQAYKLGFEEGWGFGIEKLL